MILGHIEQENNSQYLVTLNKKTQLPILGHIEQETQLPILGHIEQENTTPNTSSHNNTT